MCRGGGAFPIPDAAGAAGRRAAARHLAAAGRPAPARPHKVARAEVPGGQLTLRKNVLTSYAS